MNQTETNFDRHIKEMGLTYKHISFKNKLTTSKHEFEGDMIEIHQVPDFISIRGKEIDIIEIKHGFIHQDYPFRDKLLKMYVGRLNKVFNCEDHKQEDWILEEFLNWMKSIFNSNEKVINNIKLINKSNSYKYKLKINYFVLQPNNKKIDDDNPYSPKFVDFYKHDDHLKAVKKDELISARVYHKNFVNVLMLCLTNQIQIADDDTTHSLIKKVSFLGKELNTLIHTLKGTLKSTLDSTLISTLDSTLIKDLLKIIKLNEVNLLRNEHKISNIIKLLIDNFNGDVSKVMKVVKIFEKGLKDETWNKRRSSDFSIVKNDIREILVKIKKFDI